MILCGAALLFAGTTACLLWRNYRLKQDVYDLTRRLDGSLNELLNGVRLDTAAYRQDDLWGAVYEKLCRVSDMYARKNTEVQEEKESLKELVSDISHQTKTPLANIKLYLEMLSDEKSADVAGLDANVENTMMGAGADENKSDAAERAAYFEKLGGQVDKLDFLLQSMVKMSRLETGAIKIQKVDASLAETLAAAVGAVIPGADKKHIQIRVDYDEKLRLCHDKKWTGEAIFNILDNAVKYTKVGGNIYISVRRGEIFTRISVADTGKGIQVERQGTVFARFYREPEVHDCEGVGLGLYLARKIITMQDGYIEVESKVGRGSTFYIYLPN